MNKKYVSIGKILNFHGIQGNAKVGYSKNQHDFLMSVKNVYIQKDGEYLPFKVKSVNFNNKFAIMNFDGINSINEIEEYKNCLIFVEESALKSSLSNDEFLIDDLIGCEVFMSDKKVGVITGLSNNGVNDFLSVKGLSKKVSLVPFIKQIVLDVDMKNKKVTLDNIAGLVE